MKTFEIVLTTLIIYYILLIWLLFKYKKNKKEVKEVKESWQENDPLIVCLMITGINDERLKFARKSIDNFTEQTYTNKKLLIINHNENSFELPSDIDNNVFHFKIHKNEYMTIGELRNISLELVPLGAFWTIWDDDDIRSIDYLSTLYYKLEENQADCITFINRYEYNILTKLAWKMTLKSGFPLILCRNNPNIRYLYKHTMEDIHLLDQVRKENMKLYIYDNDPSLYVRVVHQSNTSLYVDKQKKKINHPIDKDRFIGQSRQSNYLEMNVTQKEEDIILKKVNKLLDFQRCKF